MSKRVEFQHLLETICDNVYYQSPSNMYMRYPAIIYTRKNIKTRYASNTGYLINKAYTLTVIDKDPDSEIVDKIALLPSCYHDRHYVSDGLNHDVFTIYY